MIKNLKKDFHMSGQTLVEVMIAIALLSAAVISTTMLVRQMLRSNLAAGQQTQATALGTEQMELLRAYRDDRIEEGNTGWENDIMPEASGCRTFYMRSAPSGEPELIPTSNPVYFSNDTDSYLSLYRRIIEACPGRQYNTGTNFNSDRTNDFITVEVRVFWDNASDVVNQNVYRGYLSNWNRTPGEGA